MYICTELGTVYFGVLFDDLDDWEVNHWLPSNQTSVPQLIETLVSFRWLA